MVELVRVLTKVPHEIFASEIVHTVSITTCRLQFSYTMWQPFLVT